MLFNDNFQLGRANCGAESSLYSETFQENIILPRLANIDLRNSDFKISKFNTFIYGT